MQIAELVQQEPPWVAMDIESSGLHPDDGAFVASIGLACPDWVVAYPFDQGVRDKFPTTQLDLFETEDPNLGLYEWQQLTVWLLGQKLVFHNAKFDMTIVRAGLREYDDSGVDLLPAFHWCTMVAQRELDPTHDVGLDVTAERLGWGGKVGVDAMAAWCVSHGFAKGRKDLPPWDICEPYLLGDAKLTGDLYAYQQSRIIQEGMQPLERLERKMDLLRTLYKMEYRGIGYDHKRSIEAAERLEERARELVKVLPFPPTVNGAKDYWFNKKGLSPDRSTEKGAPSLDEEQVRKWAAEGVEFAPEYAEYAKIQRQISMYYRGYPAKQGPDGRLRTTYKQTRVKSGRMSVERIQLQAMPKADKTFEGLPNVRDLVVPREGFGLWNLDLSQAELRVASQYAQCKRMLELLGEGADLHGVTNEEVLKVKRDDPLWKEKRDIAKRLTFGGIFQIGAEKFQATLSKLADMHLSLDECAALVNAWRRAYPEFGVAYRRAERKAEQDGFVRILPNTEFETRSYFGPRDYPNSGWNRMVQGSLAEFFAMWMVEVEHRFPGHMILTVHDSLLMEMPLEDGWEIAEEAAEIGAAQASKLFGIRMVVDADKWDGSKVKARQYDGASGMGSEGFVTLQRQLVQPR